MPREDAGPVPVARRSVLVAILGGIGAIGAAMLGLAGGFVANALGRARSRPWIRLAAAEDLNAETFERYVLAIERTHAWVREPTSVVVYVKDRYPDGEPIGFVATCTHLGCAVAWRADAERFECPCHGGVYDGKGDVVAGPPPRSLARLEVEVRDDDVCYVRVPRESPA